MQTFLPHPNFLASAMVLDTKRLGKQRLEVLQILRTLAEFSRGYANHPAVRMWRGHEGSLGTYGQIVCAVWKDKGYSDTLLPPITSLKDSFLLSSRSSLDFPWWFGLDKFHKPHRSKLLHKNPTHYLGLFEDEKELIAKPLEYWWPEEGKNNNDT